MGEEPVKICAYLVMNEARLSEEATLAARAAGGEWVIVNVRGGRQLVSCLAPVEMIPALLAMLASYDPVLVGAWDDGGVPVPGYEVTPATAAEYLTVVPDDIATPPDADTPGARSRPTEARDCTSWAGWVERVFP